MVIRRSLPAAYIAKVTAYMVKVAESLLCKAFAVWSILFILKLISIVLISLLTPVFKEKKRSYCHDLLVSIGVNLFVKVHFSGTIKAIHFTFGILVHYCDTISKGQINLKFIFAIMT